MLSVLIDEMLWFVLIPSLHIVFSLPCHDKLVVLDPNFVILAILQIFAHNILGSLDPPLKHLFPLRRCVRNLKGLNLARFILSLQSIDFIEVQLVLVLGQFRQSDMWLLFLCVRHHLLNHVALSHRAYRVVK